MDDPPVVQHFEVPGGPSALSDTFARYRDSLSEDRRELLGRYRLVDFALKVVGVGSVGTRCFVLLLEGHSRARSAHPPGQGGHRLRARAVRRSHAHRENQGERVVIGQRLMQATPDIFLGWTRGRRVATSTSASCGT